MSQSTECCPWIDTKSSRAFVKPIECSTIDELVSQVASRGSAPGPRTMRLPSSISILLPITTKGKFSGSLGEAWAEMESSNSQLGSSRESVARPYHRARQRYG